VNILHSCDIAPNQATNWLDVQGNSGDRNQVDICSKCGANFFLHVSLV